MLLGVDLQILINLSKYILAVYICLRNKFSLCPAGQVPREMKPLSSKRMTRIERKEKKMAALLEVSKLNELDRKKSSQIANVELTGAEIGPSAKRLRTEEIRDTEGPGTEGAKKERLKTDKGALGKSETHDDLKPREKFRLREIGEAATLAVNIQERTPLYLSDIQHLLLYAQIGHHSPYVPSRWCNLEKYTKLKHTNVLVVENVSLDLYQSHEKLFPFLSATFPHKVEIITPGAYKGDLVQDLATVPLTGTQVKKYINEFKSLEDAVISSPDVYDRIRNLFPVDSEPVEEPVSASLLPEADKFPRTDLLLSGWQMVEENFPMPIKGLMESKYAGYVLTKDAYKPVTPKSPMFGLDCEMCKTTSGDLELTRISVVDEDMGVFYEQLVKPHNPITDYLTQFSGITPRMMSNVTKRLRDVQDDLRRMLPADAILVGQSLGGDMHALKMMHPYVIDTSIIFNMTGDRIRKTKLQTLAREFLEERIQEGNSGHCSIEDSLSSLKLAQHKLAHDLYYGDAVLATIATHVRHHPSLGHPNFATSMLKHATRMEKKAHVVSLEDILSQYRFFTFKKSVKNTKINFTAGKYNQAVIGKTCEAAMKYHINVAHVRFNDNQTATQARSVSKHIDEWVRNIYEATMNPGLCVVIFGGQKNTDSGCCFITIKELP